MPPKKSGGKKRKAGTREFATLRSLLWKLMGQRMVARDKDGEIILAQAYNGLGYLNVRQAREVRKIFEERLETQLTEYSEFLDQVRSLNEGVDVVIKLLNKNINHITTPKKKRGECVS